MARSCGRWSGLVLLSNVKTRAAHHEIWRGGWRGTTVGWLTSQHAEGERVRGPPRLASKRPPAVGFAHIEALSHRLSDHHRLPPKRVSEFAVTAKCKHIQQDCAMADCPGCIGSCAEFHQPPKRYGISLLGARQCPFVVESSRAGLGECFWCHLDRGMKRHEIRSRSTTRERESSGQCHVHDMAEPRCDKRWMTRFGHAHG